ncbi:MULTISPECIES: DUF3710 domain-containing protein [unclassified Streptomyces]|uniref:DUF3710 domain-containing protein n=1 Tax=unclassified Streptomyces TaxID=2593676 RepID=UPI001C0DFFF6|nr:DUF3710 domain-containing protein [Streptomyces sp. YPW6]QWQ44941.1 DUF3710 domain-containing protein [Streptomyces sp. YPW6]
MSNSGGENGVVQQVRELLRKFAEDGVVDPSILANAEVASWDRVTLKRVMVATAQIILRIRWENGLPTVEEVAPRDVYFIPRSDLLEMTKMLLGAKSSDAFDGQVAKKLSLPNLMRIIIALFAEESISEEEEEYLISSAVDVCEESLRDGNILRRGFELGPWDISEIDIENLDLVDMGGIMVPSAPGMSCLPVEVDGEMLAATLVQGDTALQLQAFNANSATVWNAVRADMISKMRAQGNSAETWVDRAGIEIRATISVVTEPGVIRVREIRVLGSDGPGWMLRAVVSGAGAAAGGDDGWAYKTFLGAVVVPGALSRRSDVIPLYAPAI